MMRLKQLACFKKQKHCLCAESPLYSLTKEEFAQKGFVSKFAFSNLCQADE